METFRYAVAWCAIYLAFGIFTVYCGYGFYLTWKLMPYANPNGRPPKNARWDPAYYAQGAAPWLEKTRRHERRFIWVWIGCMVGGNLVYWLAKP